MPNSDGVSMLEIQDNIDRNCSFAMADTHSMEKGISICTIKEMKARSQYDPDESPED